jgi:hypothetical protein
MDLCSTRRGYLRLETAGSGTQQAEGKLPDEKAIYCSRLQSLVHIHKLVVLEVSHVEKGVLTEGLAGSAVRMILVGHRGIDDVLWLAVGDTLLLPDLVKREESTKHWMTTIRAQKTSRVARDPGI